MPPRAAEEPVLGVPLALTDYEETLAWIDGSIAHRQRGYLCVAAVHTVMLFQEDPELRDAVLNASFTVPDGQPLVWAMNALAGLLHEIRAVDAVRQVVAERVHRPHERLAVRHGEGGVEDRVA
jgi:UDP-N-acetyl-D-mannosaminuronic acid transferase (WecB/TagA/CpsF family)